MNIVISLASILFLIAFGYFIWQYLVRTNRDARGIELVIKQADDRRKKIWAAVDALTLSIPGSSEEEKILDFLDSLKLSQIEWRQVLGNCPDKPGGTFSSERKSVKDRLLKATVSEVTREGLLAPPRVA